jgi:hypothetical protein
MPFHHDVLPHHSQEQWTDYGLTILKPWAKFYSF